LSKGFKEDFFNLLSKLKRGEHFAFVRYSDGEVFVMQNKHLVLQDEYVKVGETVHNFGYSEDDHKEFIPEKHGFVKDKLIESFKFQKKNYFVGAGCGACTCAISEYIGFMEDLRPGDKEHWTSPNLLVNSNYPLFVTQFVPQFKKHKIVMVCSKNAQLEKLPFEVVKDFRVGKNCIVNDHHLEDEIKNWVSENDIKDHVFLFSASSLSEILIHKLYEVSDNNTYIDIGTTLHPYMGLSIERDYLRGYWNQTLHPDLFKDCG
tara:strand:+ start:3273 stop:4055 length:783 start_codon:yes stop_codon:yes gene_type:complete